jgi:hypothetical protein
LLRLTASSRTSWIDAQQDATPKGVLMFWRNVITSIFVVYSKRSMKPAEAGNKVVKCFTVNILVNRMARQIKNNIGMYGDVGSVTA